MSVIEARGHEEVVCSAFGYGAHEGSRAVVVLGSARWSDQAMRNVARRHALETAFVLRSQVAGSDFRFRFFLPNHEVTMCVHGTIGAVAALVSRAPDLTRQLRIETPVGVLRVHWTKDERGVVVAVEQHAVESKDALDDPSAVAGVLGLATADMDSNLPIHRASASRPKLIVPVRDAVTLDRIAPNYQALWALCDRLEVTGIYAVTMAPRCGDRDADARQFPVRAGFPEDAATGNAAAAFAGYLALRGVGRTENGVLAYRIGQGDAMGCPCLIEAEATVLHGEVVSTCIRGRGVEQPQTRLP